MCIPIDQRSGRERVLFAIANLSLAAGIVLPRVIHSGSALSGNWLDASQGLLMGVCIGLHLFLALRRRRQGLSD